MKHTKLLAAAGLAAAMTLGLSGGAFALTAAHTAANTQAQQGDCSGCHIPHRAAGAQRLFPVQPTAGAIASFGFMGAMCAEYCHDQIGTLPNAYAADTALLNPGGGANGTAQGAHGLYHVPANVPPNTDSTASSLPYSSGGAWVDSQGVAGMECTTCHNVHKNATGDASEALLQLDIDALCDDCHLQRGAGDGAWGGAYGDANTLSSHPVGTDVTGDNSTHDFTGDGTADNDSNIFIGMAVAAGNTAFDMPYTQGASSQHNLGGHLINGAAKDGASNGPITCQTCHAVHGRQFDADPAVAGVGPFEDLLTIQQSAQGSAEPTYSANGAGDALNQLCAGCHAQATAGMDWNPGATLYSHPANAQLAQGDGDVGVGALGTLSAAAQLWPFGSQASSPGMTVAVICESCHKPHGATPNSHILRADEADLCSNCHTGQFGGHHPANVAMCGGMSDPDIGNNDGTLTCEDCHNGSGAHNWATAGGVGLDPDWEPFDNGRTLDSNANRFQLDTSKECVDCHVGTGAIAAANATPTCQNDNVNADPTRASNPGGATLTNRGGGSHYVGASSNTNTHGNLASGNILGTGAFNAFTTVWPGSGTGWSRFGGTGVGTYEITCESCHDLEPDKNVGLPYPMLLQGQYEAEDTAQSNLCTGCHGLVPGGSSVHPLTGDTISKAVDDGRTPTTLITGAGSYADAAGAPGNAEYPATADQMSCDACHQPHDAPTDSGTYILEYNTGSGLGLAPVTIGATTITWRAASGQNIDHDVLCTQCHAY